MRIGASLFLIAVGAILRFAVTDQINGVDLSTVGVILMVVGAVGLLITLVLMSTRRRTDVIHQGTPVAADPRYADGGYVAGERRTTYVEPNDPRL
ncbi:DUF6458 family protein [Jatrophihabitans sp. YIM 134969]